MLRGRRGGAVPLNRNRRGRGESQSVPSFGLANIQAVAIVDILAETLAWQLIRRGQDGSHLASTRLP